MAVKGEFDVIKDFEDWYGGYHVQQHDGTLRFNGFSDCSFKKFQQFQYFKREMDGRVKNYWKYEKIADAAVVNERPDLPNVSSGEGAGFVRRIARSVVMHTPNVVVTSQFDDDSIQGVTATWIAKSKIIGDDEYSNNMQQHLYATMIRAAALGFDCVTPALLQNAQGTWYTRYDNINYRDVFPEPGAKDVRKATKVFVRRYLTRGEVNQLIRGNAPGWDVAALRSLLQTMPASREYVDSQSKKHSANPEAYEIITEYTNSGDPFLTWAASSKLLLRIEKNKHPLKEHPVFFFIPEYDGEQPFGRSLLALIYGRQEFQDWFLNGAMKLWRLNIEPPVIGYGVVNAIPNLGPGKYTQISNPNAKVVPYEVNTGTLTMFNQIAQMNAANMGQQIGAADLQAAAQSQGGMVSKTAPGVEAQVDLVDIMTNNYQKALEGFFSQYVSYALSVYFAELSGTVTSLTPSADARKQMINAGMPPEAFIHEAWEETVENEDGTTSVIKHKADDSGLKDGSLDVKFADLATLYWVKTVPGSLTELEDEKQIRLLNQLFIPLSQMMPALAQANDQAALAKASGAVQFLIQKQIELSGSDHAAQLNELLRTGGQEHVDRASAVEERLGGAETEIARTAQLAIDGMNEMREQNKLLRQIIEQRLPAIDGGQNDPSAAGGAGSPSPFPVAVA